MFKTYFRSSTRTPPFVHHHLYVLGSSGTLGMLGRTGPSSTHSSIESRFQSGTGCLLSPPLCSRA
eukprot:6762908-Pyramimonas_sp.AAC.1